MSEQVQYRVKRGVIRLPRNRRGQERVFINHGDLIHQGELLPGGIFSEADIKSWLDEGRIERADLSAEDAAEQVAAVQARSKWSVSPQSLVGKTLEDLIVMVSEIDPEYDTDELADEAAAVALLTSGWNPRYGSDTVAPQATDRTEVKSLKMDQGPDGPSTRSTEREMSSQASEALSRAKARAAAGTEKES